MAVLPTITKTYDPNARVTQGTNYGGNTIVAASSGSGLNPSYAPGMEPNTNYSGYQNPLDTNTFAAPTLTDFTNYFSTFKDQLGTAPQVTPGESLYNKFSSKAPTEVQGLGDSYFNAQRESRKEALRNEFFGPMGVLNKQASQESAAGRLGSGVGKVVLQETVTNPFMQNFAQIDRDIAQEQEKERARVQELNVTRQDSFNQFLGKMAEADSSNVLQASIANQELISKYDELAAKLAEAHAGNLTDYEMALLEQQIKAAYDADQSKQSWEDLARKREELGLQYS